MNTSWWTTKPRSKRLARTVATVSLLQAVRQGSQADAWNGLNQPHQPPRAKHPGYTETYDESQQNSRRSLEAHGFVDQRTNGDLQVDGVDRLPGTMR
ncbi:hypothetical protein GQ600_17664 [Phytophthora cactorum]|nr:hypothetical protein GQ600_17664 [Phytophthora cactorum]